MPSTYEQLSPTRVKLTIEIPFAELQPYLDKTYQEVAQQVTIPGFRKGKVPPSVIDQRFGRGRRPARPARHHGHRPPRHGWHRPGGRCFDSVTSSHRPRSR